MFLFLNFRSGISSSKWSCCKFQTIQCNACSCLSDAKSFVPRTNWNSSATMRTVFIYELNFSHSSRIQLLFISHLKRDNRIADFTTSSLYSLSGWGHFDSLCFKKSGPKNHEDSFKVSREHPREMRSAGFSDVGTWRQETLLVMSWISETRFPTNVVSVEEWSWSHLYTTDESVQKNTRG